MQFGAVDIFTILLITIGPMKAMIVFTALTARADVAFRRKVAIRAVATATGIVLLFIVAGELLLQVFHVTLPALKIAGGIILLLVALHMVMGELGNEVKDTGNGGQPSLNMAVYHAGNAPRNSRHCRAHGCVDTWPARPDRRY